jgi:Lipopolysaccharide kinase (Kdo/WaaP) family
MRSLICPQYRGWRLAVTDELTDDADIIHAALKLADTDSTPFRRSRHASTFLLHLASGQDRDLFVKYFDPPVGWERVKSWCRRPRRFRAEHTTAALRAAGFLVPPVLLHGVHLESRRELIVTARAEGDGPILALRKLGSSLAVKRAVLRALGREIGRLHLAGFIHGDLTPFNIRIVIDEPPRFALIDNDRTRRNVIIGRNQRRMRNLVQLGRFAFPGITRSDRMRFFRAYEAALRRDHSPYLEREVSAMLRRRIGRDRAS